MYTLEFAGHTINSLCEKHISTKFNQLYDSNQQTRSTARLSRQGRKVYPFIDGSFGDNEEYLVSAFWVLSKPTLHIFIENYLTDPVVFCMVKNMMGTSSLISAGVSSADVAKGACHTYGCHILERGDGQRLEVWGYGQPCARVHFNPPKDLILSPSCLTLLLEDAYEELRCYDPNSTHNIIDKNNLIGGNFNV